MKWLCWDATQTFGFPTLTAVSWKQLLAQEVGNGIQLRHAKVGNIISIY